ncbi:GDSL-type esterase/lipase family protein [Frisingicoccus sp.]|uniref:GDSL-type esterase/lipase family protein n=1 Tax=Frisingicoccus sp. TaxID=1918627 RepID=UPI003AB74402
MERTDLVCLGDSIVYGYGVSERYAWPCLASRELGIHILNKGENGDTADGMNVRFMEDVVWNHPKEVFVMAGANDILMGIPQAHTRESMDMIIQKALAANILPIIGIPLQVDGAMLKKCWYSFFSIEETMEIFRSYREWLLDYCEKKQIPYVDFQKKFPEYIEKKGISRAFRDGVHPTKEGYAVMADIFCDTYRKMKGVVL